MLHFENAHGKHKNKLLSGLVDAPLDAHKE